MEPTSLLAPRVGAADGMRRAKAGGTREPLARASGKWVAHLKMAHIVRPVWEDVGADNQLGRDFPPLTYTQEDADGLVLLEPAPRTIRGARDLLSVALQYGNAFGQGFQAAALRPADFFGDDDQLYLMEDVATGEIRVSIWEWLQKGAKLTDDDPATGTRTGDTFDAALFGGVREAAHRPRPRRPRRFEGGDHASHRAGDRREICHQWRQGTERESPRTSTLVN
jgi:malate synthase